jgi:peptidoglycan glycosyltransferase
MGRRIRWLGVVLILCFGLVIVQLTNIQFRRASALATSPDNPVNRAPNFDNDRGMIFAADGTPLAQSVRIAPKGADAYQFQRVYPTRSLFSQIVGVCSPDPVIGCDSGVEGYYSQQLGLHSQSAQTLSQLLSPPAPTTDDITLTVDPALQQLATQELAGLPGPDRDGAIVVLNPKTGAILAMASNPTYDPTPLVSTDYKTAETAQFADSIPDGEGFKPLYPIATYYPIAPGSTAKVLTTAAIYNLDPSLATYNFPTSRCLTNIPDTNQEICNDADTASAADACGGTIIQMLPASCDPGYAKLGLLLGANDLAEQAALFGFNTAPPLDTDPDGGPAGHIVQPSQYPTAQDMSATCDPSSPLCVGVPGEAYAAFGQQDVEATALQNALVAAGIANGGAVMAPHFLEKIVNAQGQVVETYQPKVWKQAMTPQSAQEVIPLMQSVATSGTAAGDGFPSSLDVAVKTGTAQVGVPTITSVSDWMIGFAPASNPAVAIAVVVPFQPLSTQGASIAGPIVKKMLEAALQ